MASRRVTFRVLEIGAAVAVMVLLVLWMAGAFGHKIEPGRVEGRTIAAAEDAARTTVEEVVVPIVEEAAGTVQAERKTVVSAQIVAVIRDVRVRAGDQVAAGDTLIVLDDRELIARVQEARRSVQGTEAARSKAEADFRRASQLIGRGVISQSELDQAEATFKVADAELGRARQGLQAAEVALSYAEMQSPVAGRIVDRLADPGDTALPGKPLLSLYDPTALRMEVAVRESLVTHLKVGEAVEVRLGADAEMIEGRVDEIVPQAEAGSRTFLVKVGLPRRPGMYTGMFGRVRFAAGERRRVLVAEAAIEHIGQLDFADVVGAEGTVARRLVTLGAPAGEGRVEVLSGLRAGEAALLRK